MVNPYPLPRQLRETDALVGNGGSVYGPFAGFKIFDIADVDVWTRPDAADVWTEADVTVTKTVGDAFDTFSITFPYTVPATTRFKVVSRRTHERTAGVENGTRLDMTALEKELSKQGTVLQELRRDVDRGVQVQFGPGLIMADDLDDGDTLMKSGTRLVKGANAADITLAQGYAAAAGDSADAAAIFAAAASASAAGVNLPSIPAGSEAKFLRVKADLSGYELQPEAAAASRSVLKSMSPSFFKAINLTEGGRSGLFVWTSGDFSSQVAADTLEGIYIAANSVPASSGCWVRALPDGQMNIKWFGAVGGGIVDCSPALAAAYAMLPSSGGAIFIPAEVFRLASMVSLIGSKAFAIVGVDRFASTLLIDQAGADGVFVQSAPLFGICDVGLIGNIDRNAGTFNLHVKDVATAHGLRGYARNTKGGLYYFENCNTTQLCDLTGTSNTSGASGDTCLRLKSSSGTFSNLVFRIGGSAGFGRSPCLQVSGPITSMHFFGCTFAGAGPTWSLGVAAINSAPSDFTINAVGSHARQVGDYIVLRNMAPAAYNGLWRVTAVPSASQLTVTSTINPGSATVLGTVEGPTTCAHITNVAGPCNESEITGCLFEGLALTTYGSVGLFFEARDAYVPGLRAPLSGWNLNGNYYDFGYTGLMLHGHSEAASTLSTIHGITINGGMFENKTRGIHIENARGIRISDFQGNAYQDAADDDISVSAEIFIRGTADTLTRGIAISGGFIGMSRFWDNTFSIRSKRAGILLDGSAAALADLIFKADLVFGTTAAIVDNAGKLGAADVYRNNTVERSGSL
jgi:hypothetical protein